MMTSYFNTLKYAATGITSPDMSYYDRMRASTLMDGVIKTLTGIPPLSFKADGSPLTAWSISGNGVQTGTPSPDSIIMPTFCGKLVGTDWTIPITCGVQTVTVNLGQTQTVRRVRKLVFDGTEAWGADRTDNFYSPVISGAAKNSLVVCSHQTSTSTSLISENCFISSTGRFNITTTAVEQTTTAWKQFLSDEYSAGTPITIWYVLATEQTGIINEPLCKIGTFADELSSTDAGVSIPTAKGSNTLTVGGDLQPSEMTITYRG